MRILVDSNIIIRLFDQACVQHQVALEATEKLRLTKNQLCLVPQNIYEVWSVATRPANVNGLGLSFAQVQAEVAGLRGIYDRLDETPAVFVEWEKLIALHTVVGKNVHDTRLIASMVVHGLTHLLTFNQQDFQRFTNITILSPTDVVAGTAP
jgi:predicted nucleic acid-binding protein